MASGSESYRNCDTRSVKRARIFSRKFSVAIVTFFFIARAICEFVRSKSASSSFAGRALRALSITVNRDRLREKSPGVAYARVAVSMREKSRDITRKMLLDNSRTYNYVSITS